MMMIMMMIIIVMKCFYNIKYSSARCIKFKYELHVKHVETPQAENDNNN